MEILIIIFLLIILAKSKPVQAKDAPGRKRKVPTDYSGDDWGW